LAAGGNPEAMPKLERKTSHERTTNHHTFTTICPRFYHRKIAFPAAQSPNKLPLNQMEPLKNHNSPQLTTKAEDWFYPQPTGPSSAIDFTRLKNIPSVFLTRD
jgi:hypothetical protein